VCFVVVAVVAVAVGADRVCASSSTAGGTSGKKTDAGADAVGRRCDVSSLKSARRSLSSAAGNSPEPDGEETRQKEEEEEEEYEEDDGQDEEEQRKKEGGDGDEAIF